MATIKIREKMKTGTFRRVAYEVDGQIKFWERPLTSSFETMIKEIEASENGSKQEVAASDATSSKEPEKDGGETAARAERRTERKRRKSRKEEKEPEVETTDDETERDETSEVAETQEVAANENDGDAESETGETENDDELRSW